MDSAVMNQLKCSLGPFEQKIKLIIHLILNNISSLSISDNYNDIL